MVEGKLERGKNKVHIAWWILGFALTVIVFGMTFKAPDGVV